MFFLNYFLICLPFCVLVAIQEYNKPKSLIFWVVIVLMFCVIGFCAYVVFGNNLKFWAKKRIEQKHKSTKNYIKYASWYKQYKRNNITQLNNVQKQVCKKLDIWHNNKIKFFQFGQEFLQELLNDIKKAEHFINLEFYIFADDKTGELIKNALIEKANQGVAINIIYDAIGSRKTKKSFWKELAQNGIVVVPFFPSLIINSFINFKLNYRKHRKIVVIDGLISYTGGINLRDDHMNKHKNCFRGEIPWSNLMGVHHIV